MKMKSRSITTLALVIALSMLSLSTINCAAVSRSIDKVCSIEDDRAANILKKIERIRLALSAVGYAVPYLQSVLDLFSTGDAYLTDDETMAEIGGAISQLRRLCADRGMSGRSGIVAGSGSGGMADAGGVMQIQIGGLMLEVPPTRLED
jgi:hypothetical protein